MKTAVIVVDYQQDFRKGGALGADRSEEIRDNILNLVAEADVVVASRDWHPDNHCSFSDEPTFEDGSWPRHCVQETPGAQIDTEIEKRVDIIVSKGTDPKKDAYSAFKGAVNGEKKMDLSHWLEGHDVDHVTVCGLVDEYCVKNTAIDAVREGYRTTLCAPASAALSEEGEKVAIGEMRRAGVHISERVPRGDREPTRDEALNEAIDTIALEAEEAEQGNQHDLVEWYTVLVGWIREEAERNEGAFMIAFPTAFFNNVETIKIPEAQVTAAA